MIPGARLNMADVAALAGVSKATVSRVLNDAPGVSEPTRVRIRALVKDLSYVVSPDASRLSRGSTGRIAVLMPQTTSWFYGAVLSGVLSALRGSGIDTLVYQVSDDENNRRLFHELPVQRQVDALVVVAFPVTDDERRQLDLLGVPVVVAGGAFLDHPHVRIDDAAAARQAVGHLIDAGHERIAMISSSVTRQRPYAPPAERLDGFRAALGEAGLDVDESCVVELPWSPTMGAEGMDRLLRLRRPPTAVFGFCDEVAAGALRSLRRAGIGVPQHVSVIGIDDHPVAELTDLTTVSQAVERQGEEAGRMALALLRGEPVEQERLTVPTHLVVRATTGPPPG
jgi:LacI family repressor for deo operon, udp, cdd, tsx, nupC, and nupG